MGGDPRPRLASVDTSTRTQLMAGEDGEQDNQVACAANGEEEGSLGPGPAVTARGGPHGSISCTKRPTTMKTRDRTRKKTRLFSRTKFHASTELERTWVRACWTVLGLEGSPSPSRPDASESKLPPAPDDAYAGHSSLEEPWRRECPARS